MSEYKSVNVKELAVEVREALKKEFPECKFSVTSKFFSMGQSIQISLQSAPWQAFAEPERSGYAELYSGGFKKDASDLNVNGYELSPEAWKVMSRVDELVSKDHYVDSDIQSDWYQTNYYIHLNIGQYGKPFKVTA